MDDIIEIYEIQNIGKGLITTLIPDNLLLIKNKLILTEGVGANLSGDGTKDNPLFVTLDPVPIISTQKIITYPADFTGTNYTLQNADKDKLIFIVNGVTDVTITVSTGLPDEFFAALLQKGSGLVTIIQSSTTVIPSKGMKIEGQNFQVALDKIGATEVFHLTGNNKV